MGWLASLQARDRQAALDVIAAELSGMISWTSDLFNQPGAVHNQLER
jgi:hypothetical protein